jgi:capsid protein
VARRGGAAGAVDAPDFYENRYAYSRCRFIFGGKGWVDPVKEAQAAVLRVAGGLSTLEQECAEQGLDYEEVLDQRADRAANDDRSRASTPTPPPPRPPAPPSRSRWTRPRKRRGRHEHRSRRRGCGRRHDEPDQQGGASHEVSRTSLRASSTRRC